ncbi:unnamed protein product [Peniophora sp. CBMAI 1063]|nr:unnamed protein product [Peniophora sp. CBMAI 1063]
MTSSPPTMLSALPTPSGSTSISSLLNSLHSHLQSQTQLLPALHTQLGLPPAALADELSLLQQSLTRCVEEQIDGRRREVDQWMLRCEEAEAECVNYNAVLGSGVKGSGCNFGEIRKEHVLPKRYELLTEMQERLRRVYHTKLEQLLTLTSRIATLVRTLPDGFYPDDLLEPLMDGHISAHRDVSPERFAKLEKELVRGKGEITRRLQYLGSEFVQIDYLHSELGIALPDLDLEEPLYQPAASSLGLAPISRPPSALAASSSQYGQPDPFLVATPTPSMRSASMYSGPPSASTSAFSRTMPPAPPEEDERLYQRIFGRFAVAIENASEEDIAAVEAGRKVLGLDGVQPTPGLLDWAVTMRGALEQLKRAREVAIQAMYDQLEVLWRRMGVPDTQMDAFVDANRGATEEVVRAYEQELDGMLELKRERMAEFVENARAEIAKLWEELMLGEEERTEFAAYYDDEFTEELLVIHEDEIRRLKEERREKAHLLGSIKRWFEICEEEKELAASAADVSRLTGRGARDPGRLLREEKMRKRVKKEKPRLEQELMVAIPAWEADSGRPFQVHGESVLQLLLESGSGSSSDSGKENKRAGRPPPARAGSVPARATTPETHSQNRRAAQSRPASAGSTKRPAPSSSDSESNKRQRLGNASANKIPPVPPLPSNSKLVMPMPVKASAGSTLPRPTAMRAQHAALGHGRAPPNVRPGIRQVSAPAAQAQARLASAGARAGPDPQTAAKKASRARRESFKPRPSTDAGWAPQAQRFGGLEDGGLKEEEEDG